jgi:hypothetical protein
MRGGKREPTILSGVTYRHLGYTTATGHGEHDGCGLSADV